MDVTKILEADHRDVERWFSEIERTEGADRAAIVQELATALQAHMELEEEVVYPAMVPVTGAEAVQEGENEHDVARNALTDMVALAPDEPGFSAALEAVKAAIEHHVEEEEGDVFPQLRKEGPKVLAEMATPFMAKRLDLGLPMTADALSASSTKDELAEEAEKAGIDGAGSMKKDQLAKALADAMA